MPTDERALRLVGRGDLRPEPTESAKPMFPTTGSHEKDALLTAIAKLMSRWPTSVLADAVLTLAADADWDETVMRLPKTENFL